MPKFKAIIFDFDGTLVDSEYFHFTVANEVLNDAFGVTMSHTYYSEVLEGVPTSSSSISVVKDFNLNVSPKELADMFEKHMMSRKENYEVAMMPFADEAIKLFLSRDLPLAIVTGSGRKDVEATLMKKDLRHHFKQVITWDDVDNSKPAPDSYNLCVEKMGYPVSDYLVFEDTENGLKSAKAAGLTAYAIQKNKLSYNKLAIADRIFPDLNEATSFLLEEKLI